MGYHLSLCVAQISCKTTLDEDSSCLKMTIANLYENSPVILKSNSVQTKEIETSQLFSDEKVQLFVDKRKLLEITLYFYDKNKIEQKNINIRISDKILQENAIAPLDSVSFTFYCLRMYEISNIRKLEVRISVPYTVLDGKTLEGRYESSDYVYLPSLEK